MGQDSVESIVSSFGLNIPSGGTLLKDDFPISPIALAEAFSILADSGTLAGQSISAGSLHPAGILNVSSNDHSVWADWAKPQTRSLLSLPLAYLMNQVLSDETTRWASLGHPNPLEIGRPAGAKLSHTLDLSSAWTVGYTPQRVAVIWMGTGSAEMKNADAKAGPVPPRLSADLWHALMQYALRELPSESWDMPSGIVNASVCDPSGLLPTSACPNIVKEIFLTGRQPVQADTLYQTFQVNAETGLLATVFTPPELVEKHTYMVVPAEAAMWANAAGVPTPPSTYDTFLKPPILPDVHISAPTMFSDGHGKLEIRGSAAGADFSWFRLEYGQGLYPLAWFQIGADNRTPVTEGLLGEWDTTGLNGLYALRLMTVRKDQRVDQVVVQVTLDNTPPQVAITYPQAGQTISVAQEPQVALQAQAGDSFLVSVEFLVDDVRVGKSITPPFGVIWTAKTGRHILKVVATDRAGNTTEVRIDFTVGK
jgi:membrane carboxypeptidase/penicillin-binding protein PbpC